MRPKRINAGQHQELVSHAEKRFPTAWSCKKKNSDTGRLVYHWVKPPNSIRPVRSDFFGWFYVKFHIYIGNSDQERRARRNFFCNHLLWYICWGTRESYNCVPRGITTQFAHTGAMSKYKEGSLPHSALRWQVHQFPSVSSLILPPVSLWILPNKGRLTEKSMSF